MLLTDNSDQTEVLKELSAFCTGKYLVHVMHIFCCTKLLQIFTALLTLTHYNLPLYENYLFTFHCLFCAYVHYRSKSSKKKHITFSGNSSSEDNAGL